MKSKSEIESKLGIKLEYISRKSNIEDYENLIRDPNLYTMSRDGLVNFDQDKDLYYYKIAEKNGGII